MTPGKMALLSDRSTVSVRGPDAGKLLQDLITNDLTPLAQGRSFGTLPSVHAALLSPQGKILFEMLVVRLLARGMAPGDAYVLDTSRSEASPLADRLKKYKLRADVVIDGASDAVCIAALWGADDTELASALPVAFDASPTHYKDPRHPALGLRWELPRLERRSGEQIADRMLASALRSGKLERVNESEYHAHRIALGVPEGGKDYAFGDTFPHDANFDLLCGVSFTKGCFVGQEVVSRMQHRGLARKRIVIIDSDAPLASGGEITAGSSMIGTIGSVADNRALALVRLDRAEEAHAKGDALTVGGHPVKLRLPGYFAALAPAGAP